MRRWKDGIEEFGKGNEMGCIKTELASGGTIGGGGGNCTKIGGAEITDDCRASSGRETIAFLFDEAAASIKIVEGTKRGWVENKDRQKSLGDLCDLLSGWSEVGLNTDKELTSEGIEGE